MEYSKKLNQIFRVGLFKLINTLKIQDRMVNACAQPLQQMQHYSHALVSCVQGADIYQLPL